jgi:hypothetical protein
MPEFQLPPASFDRLARWRAAFGRVGWFIPAFVSTYMLDKFAEAIEHVGEQFEQEHLELFLGGIHTPHRLAAMTLHRYPQTPLIRDYSATISEAVQAHMIGLHHVAIGGLVPVIEGAGRRMAEERGLAVRNVSKLFKLLVDDCKREAVERNIGQPPEIEAMLDAFAHFTTEHLYANSANYPLSDKTNRHGIAHGAYADSDYGRPLNFFKAMSAIDVLTFISILRHPGSVFVPEQTPECAAFLACVKAQATLKSALIKPAGAS